MPLTPPPLVNADTIRTSPLTWWPVHVPVPFAVEQSESLCRNQNATFASPLFEFRSRPKYRIWWSSAVEGVPRSSVYAAAYVFMMSFLLRRLFDAEHCQPGFMSSVSLLPVANVVESAVAKTTLPF